MKLPHNAKHAFKGLAAASLMVSLLGLAACSKQEETPGQQLDKAIEQTKQAASEAASAVQGMASEASRAASEAASTVKDMASEASQAASEAAASAGQAMKDVKQDAADAAGQAKDSLQQAGEQAREAVSTLGDKASEAATSVKQASTDAAAAAGEALSDTAITARISADLARDSELSAIKIDVETKDGVVTLRGEAPSSAARTRAEDLAQASKGVKSVKNELVTP